MHIIIEEKQTFYFTVKYLPSSFTTVLSVLHMPSGDLSQALEQVSNDDHEGVDRESLLAAPDETQEDKNMAQRRLKLYVQCAAQLSDVWDQVLFGIVTAVEKEYCYTYI